MAWREIEESDLQLKLTEAELSAVGEVLFEGIASVTDKVRGYVASSGAAMDSDVSTIPARLISSACDLLAVELYIRLGGTLMDPKGHRKDAKDAAIRLFEQVAQGKFSIEDPVTQKESKASSTPSYKPTRRRQFTRGSQDGI